MRGKHSYGSVLISALWVLTFLGVLAVIFSAISADNIDLAGRLEERKRLHDISSSGVAYALGVYMEELRTRSDERTGHLNSWWANEPGLFGPTDMGYGQFELGYYYDDNVTGARKRWYGFTDEDRRININRAPQDVLQRLFTVIGGVSDERAEKISLSVIDWRDRDDILYNQEGGMSEKAHYRSRGYRYVPPNRDLVEIEELLLVDGMDRDIYLKVEPYITVFITNRVNVNTACRKVLECLGLSASAADKLVRFRSGPDRREGTDGDHVFTSERRILHDIRDDPSFSETERSEITQVVNRGLLTTRSSAYRGVVTASMPGSLQKGVSIFIFNRTGRVAYHAFAFQSDKGG